VDSEAIFAASARKQRAVADLRHHRGRRPGAGRGGHRRGTDTRPPHFRGADAPI